MHKKEDILAVERNGEKFSGYNKPKRTPSHKTKSHAVLAKDGDSIKLIRFGQQGVSGAGNKTDSKSNARILFFIFRLSNIFSNLNLSAAYWANKVKW